jgi:hypothetical protein
MANINLSQSSLERNNQESNSIFDKSLAISLFLIVVSFVALFGLKVYNASVEKRTAALDADITTQLAVLEGDSVNRVVDFQERMSDIDAKLSSTTISPQDMFASIEKLMVSGAILDSYKYDVTKKTLALKVMSDDFKVVARQVMSLKSFNSFKNVTVESTSKDDTGKVASTVIISL